MVTTRISTIGIHRDGTQSVVVERSRCNLAATLNGVILAGNVIDVCRLDLYALRNRYCCALAVVGQIDIVAFDTALSRTGRVVCDEVLQVCHVPDRRGCAVPLNVCGITSAYHVQHQIAILNSQ